MNTGKYINIYAQAQCIEIKLNTGQILHWKQV